MPGPNLRITNLVISRAEAKKQSWEVYSSKICWQIFPSSSCNSLTTFISADSVLTTCVCCQNWAPRRRQPLYYFCSSPMRQKYIEFLNQLRDEMSVPGWTGLPKLKVRIFIRIWAEKEEGKEKEQSEMPSHGWRPTSSFSFRSSSDREKFSTDENQAGREMAWRGGSFGLCVSSTRVKGPLYN